MALAALFVTVALIVIGGKSDTTFSAVSTGEHILDGDTPDLPCPWCLAQTSEQDDHCPSCGQRFG